jgi:hypothetical protein
VQSIFDHANQAAIIALFRVMNRYVGNLPPMPGVFPDSSESNCCPDRAAFIENCIAASS